MAEQENRPRHDLPHERSPLFRVCFADGTLLTTYADPVGTRIQLTFTRIDLTPEGESFELSDSTEGRLVQAGPSDYRASARKVQEVAVLFRPDHAYELARAIMENLSQLPEAQRQRYNLPAIRLDPVSQEGTP
jgi:hypothetical protein